MQHRFKLSILAAALTMIAATPTFATAQRVGIQPQLMPTCGDGGDPDPFPDFKARPSLALSASGKVHGVSAATAVIGRNADEVKARFASVIEANFEHGATSGVINHLSDKELAAIAGYYGQARGTEDTPLMKTLATRLDDAALARVAKAFGREQVAEAVRTYATPDVQSAFAVRAAAMQPAMLPPPGGGGGGGGSGGGNPPGTTAGPSPTFDMTLEEIYLEFRTAPVGSLSVEASLAQTTIFAGGAVYLSYKTGDQVGTQINGLIDKYDPSLGDAIGGTVAGSIDAMANAADDVSKGHYESAYDELFGYPVTHSGTDGDWDTAAPMVEYYDAGGDCGW
ncbi:MAG: hypothetical protein AAGC76_02020 [Luteibacter sp.]|uniref:hypothetical protein n=1 Tax=Luteibacter sp. TaxID=1886636 RepID=UPI002806DE58|nr:hypothetical protein [Luteibacter sp.]MDQ7994610.1 hypothetical protein [Luteibacter sp.]